MFLHRVFSLCLAALMLAAGGPGGGESAPELTTLTEAALALQGPPEEEAAFAPDFSDAAFVGNSRTEGLRLYADLPAADYFSAIGLTVDRARTDDVVTLSDGSRGSVPEAMAEKQYRRIYVMFGVNELWWTESRFLESYVALLREIQARQPDAVLYVQTIFPVGREKSQTDDVFNNANVERFNRLVREAAEITGATLLETGQLLDDGSGNLREELSTDGIHLTAKACQLWRDYLIEAS